jgi:AcrR family transcriptional regulator
MEKALTPKGAATRQRMISAAAQLIRENGVAKTTLDDVLATTSTSKSQLFHYFPAGRADLLRAVAEHEATQVIEVQQPFLRDLSSWAAWQGWQRAVMRHYFELGELCPLGALTSELGKSSPETRAIVNTLFEEWEAALARGVEAASGATGAEAKRLARSILTAIQGGVVLLRATGRPDYLETALATAIEPLRPAGSVSH